jgi:ABC-2 type transport system permease protein
MEKMESEMGANLRASMRARVRVRESLRVVWAIAFKDILDAIKNKTTISIMIGVAMVMFSSQALPLMIKFKETPTAVAYDAGRSRLLKGLVSRGDFDLVIVDTQEEMETIIAEAPEVLLGLSIPADFDRLTGSGERMEIQGYYVHWADPGEVVELSAFFEEQLSGASWQSVRIDAQGGALYPSFDAGGWPFMASLTLVVAILVIGMTLVPYLIVEEKEAHTMGVLLVSPARYNEVILGKALAGLFYCLVAAMVQLAFIGYLFVRWEIVALAVVLGALFSVMVGLLVGVFAETASSIGMFAGLGLGLFMLPAFFQEFLDSGKLPVLVQNLVPWFPSTATTRLFRMAMGSQALAGQLWADVAILAVSCALVFILVVWALRRAER